MIEVRHLRKEYPNVTPLSDVNTTIAKGDVVSIIGPSGTGKSTFLRCLNGLELPTAGEILLDGVNIYKDPGTITTVRQKMGMVFQSFNLFAHLTIIENTMMAPVDLLGLSRQDAYDEAMRLLKSVGLAEKAKSYPGELSGGQQQRAAIVRALAMRPEVLLFDEPTSALDPTMVGEVLTVIRNLAREGLTMVIVTHEMKFARDVSSRIFYMDQGIIYEEGAPDAIFGNPQKQRTRIFVKQLRNFHYDIESRNFDFVAVANNLAAFAHGHGLSAAQNLKFQQLFEEMCVATIIPALPDAGLPLRFDASCTEAGDVCEVSMRWEGEPFNPLEEGDKLATTIALAKTTSASHAFANGSNHVQINF